ncbi:unnamed protein product [Cuscuta epithymum]|uniref:TF-B3 domain-containing protein n=1 Tax=Cuscuta epithymum TaxID=186058 RepID=A0AAV0GJH8_9ASTE|nr:unnamed protein product [Cuscuta epithymum]
MFDLTCCEKDCHGQSETYNNIIDGEGCAQGSNGDGVQLHKHEKVTTDKNRKRVTKGVNISPREQCPQFTKTITPYNLRAKFPMMHVPRAFCLANGFCHNIAITLKGRSGEHQVSFRFYGDPGGYICDGWREFATSNHLKIGDTCIFKLCSATLTSDAISVFDVEILHVVT